MPTRFTPLALAFALVLAASSRPASAQDFSPEELARRQVERRAVEAVLWGI
jgi:hypothetical protein